MKQNFITGIDAPNGLALDSSHIYWADYLNSKIGRADIGGGDVDLDFVTGADKPGGVAAGRYHVYWSNGGFFPVGTTIGRVNRDGSDPDQSFITGASGPVDLAVFPPPR